MNSDKFSAAPAAVGYLYQCKYALLAALDQLGQRPLRVALETLDDVVFPNTGSGEALLQVKHHQGLPGPLTDYSADLWTTLRVWSERTAAGALSEDAVLFLVTTATCAQGSAASRLRPDLATRDVEAAERMLSEVARDAASDATAKGRRAFLDLKRSQRLDLLLRVTVLESQPQIDELDHLLERKLRYVRPTQAAYVRETVVEWWYRRCAELLSKRQPQPIEGVEIDAKIESIADSLQWDNLPIDQSTPDDLDVNLLVRMPFMRQLDLLKVGQPRVLQAAKDYMRAFSQRSRWLSEDLLPASDLSAYEAQLVEEWRMRYNVMCDEVGLEDAEDALRDEGRKLYKWVELEANFPIRPRCTQSFVTRGSFHMLSDELRVGWHPRFGELLDQALGEETA